VVAVDVRPLSISCRCFMMDVRRLPRPLSSNDVVKVPIRHLHGKRPELHSCLGRGCATGRSCLALGRVRLAWNRVVLFLVTKPLFTLSASWIPRMLDVNGIPIDLNHRMLQQLPDMLAQLEWMVVAMKNLRDSIGTF
jgi:hypothetical protein